MTGGVVLKTAEEYKESLRKMRPNIYKFNELIKDVATHPATKRTVEGHAKVYEVSLDPKYQDVFTTVSTFTGKQISRYLSLITCAEDMWANSRMKRAGFNMTGTCTGGRCVGFNSLNAMYSTTYDIDQEFKTNYHERLKKWIIDAQERDITCAGALTDPKGDRTKSASQQADPDMNLRIVERRPDGVVVRGAKVMICGVAAANEIFVLPGSALKDDEKDYAISFAIPRDAQNLTIVEARHPSDGRSYEEGFDNPVACGGITQAYLLFDDVFVPNDRIFLNGETKYTLTAIMNFIVPYRSAIGGCVAGQGDVMLGAAALIARANGLSEKNFTDKMVQMSINNETTYATGIAAAALGKKHPSGVWLCDPLLANVNKVHVATLPYETKRLLQDIAGGIGETGCMPSYKDLQDPRYGDKLKKYLKAAAPGEERAKIARLIEWLTIGEGVPGCMHGGGSPDGAKVVIRSNWKLKEAIEHAKRIANVKDW